jgi:predicted dipeptidase
MPHGSRPLPVACLFALALTAPAPAAADAACAALAPHLAAGARALAAEAPATGPEAFALYREGIARAARTGGAAEEEAAARAVALAPGRAVAAADLPTAGCLLRGYLAARYGERIVADLREMIAFRTFAEDGRANWDAPEFGRQREWLAGRAAGLGLEFKSFDGRVEEITLAAAAEAAGGAAAPGSPAPILAVLTHGDVQGVEGQQWSSPPWEGRLVGDRIVGRGTEDDKGPIVATLYALAALRDTGWPRASTIKLLVANGEESSWEEIPYYLERAPAPAMTLGIDAAYPVTHAQKGFGVLTVRAGAEGSAGAVAAGAGAGRVRVLRVSGGSGLSIIPERGEALIEMVSGTAEEALPQLAQLAGAWAAAHPPARLTVTREGSSLKIAAEGRGGHSSVPASGHNALGDLTAFLSTFDLVPDAWGRLVAFLGGAIGTETDGHTLGVTLRDEVMGELTVNLAVIGEEEGRPVARINLRVPRGLSEAEIGRRVAARAMLAGEATPSVATEFQLLSQPHLVPAEGPLVSTLLAVWEEVTSTPGRPIAIGGGTQASLFPGGVDFGPALSMETYRGHGTDEYLTAGELLRVGELTATALLRLTAP